MDCSYCKTEIKPDDSGEVYHEACRPVFVGRLTTHTCINCGQQPGTNTTHTLCDSCQQSGAPPSGYPGGS